MYSSFSEDIVEFSSSEEVTFYDGYTRLIETGRPLYLTVWPVNASEAVQMKHIDLDPKKCDGHTFRYTVVGWGLVQLYFRGKTQKGLESSHTNHNSEARAKKWAATYLDELGSPEQWNWSEVTRVSSKLNRYIRKCAVRKIGARPILRHADDILKHGAAAL